MPRLMSVAFTEQAVVERRKTVTRRKGWTFLKPGDRLTLVRKAMGRKPDEPLVRLAEVEVLDVHRELLLDIAAAGELTAEGFPDLEALNAEGCAEFVRRYFRPQGLDFHSFVTRIEWRYLDEPIEVWRG